MASKKVNIDIQTTANTSGAKQAANELNKVAAAANNVDKAADRAAAKAASVRGAKISNLAAQAQDIGVQLQMGTSLATTIAQQGPQIASAFGPTGAVVGSIIALGALSFSVFKGLVSNAKEAGEAAQEMGAKLEEALKESGSKNAKEFAEDLRKVTDGILDAKNAEIELTAARQNRAGIDESLIKANEELLVNAVKYLATNGQIVDQEKAIAEIRKKAAEDQIALTKQQSKQAIETEQAKLQAILDQKTNAEEEAKAIQDRINRLQNEQQMSLKILNLLREQDKRAEGSYLTGGLGKDAGYQSPARARAEAENKAIDEEIKSLQEQVNAASARIPAIINAAYEQGFKIDAALQDAQMQVEGIEQSLAIEEKSQAITDAASRMGESAKAIETEISKFQPINEVQQQAKDALMAAAADGQITSDDTRQVATNLQILLGSLKGSQAQNIESLNELIAMNRDLANKIATANREISTLKQKIETMAPIR